MSIFQAVILGIVQGLTEFLPVSSSGHLKLLERLLGVNNPSMFFEVLLHIGTLIPVVIVFWKEVAGLIRRPFQKMTYLLVTATIPAVIVTLLFGSVLENLSNSVPFLALAFVITGIALITADRLSAGKKKEGDISYTDAAVIGCAQAVAILPGISRSGSTITVALSRKLNREAAAKFAFLMSIPAIGGAAVLQVADIIKGDISIGGNDVLPMAAGFLASALSGYLAVNFMLKLIKRAKLSYFSIYVFALAGFILVDMFILGGRLLQ